MTHIPAYLVRLIRRFEPFAVPNLGTLVAALAFIVFIAIQSNLIPAEPLLFIPSKVLAGEWTRLFSFPLESRTHIIWLLFYCLVIYYIFNGIEAEWGASGLTVFVGMSYFLTAGAGLLFADYYLTVDIWQYVILNVSFAFATLFPNFVFYMFLIIPMKAKWMAYLGGAYYGLVFLTSPVAHKIFLLMALGTYLLFFGGYLLREVRGEIRRLNHKRRNKDNPWG